MTFLVEAATGLCVVGALLGAVAVITCRRTATGILGFTTIGAFVAVALALRGAPLLALGQLVVSITILVVATVVAWVAIPRGRTEEPAGRWELPPPHAALFGVAWVAVIAAVVILGLPDGAPAPPTTTAAPWPVLLAFGLGLVSTAGLAFVHFATEPLRTGPETKS